MASERLVGLTGHARGDGLRIGGAAEDDADVIKPGAAGDLLEAKH